MAHLRDKDGTLVRNRDGNIAKTTTQGETINRERIIAKYKRKWETITINQQLRKQLNHQQQLAALDLRLGKGVGAVAERAKLLKRIEEEEAAAKLAAELAAEEEAKRKEEEKIKEAKKKA